MQFKFLLLAKTCSLVFLPSFGYVEELDFHSWHEEAQPLPNEWTHYKLKKGVETGVWNGGAYFESREGWLLSPVFRADIRSVTVFVETSKAEPSRRLYLHPIAAGVTNEQGIALDPTPSRDYVEQTFSFAQYDADQLVLKFSDSGSDGNWGMIRIVVRYDDESTDEKETVPRQSWSIAAIVQKPGYRDADLGNLQYVYPEKTNPWMNGETVNGFYAFSKDGPCTNIRIGNPSSTYYGLYVIVTNDASGPLRALALLGTGGSAMSLTLPIALDAPRRIERLSVGYRVWELANGKTSALSLSYRTFDDLEMMAAEDEEWTILSEGEWRSKDTNVVRQVGLPVRSLQGAKFLCLRWSTPKKEFSPIIGISNVRVSAEIKPSGFAVIIK